MFDQNTNWILTVSDRYNIYHDTETLGRIELQRGGRIFRNSRHIEDYFCLEIVERTQGPEVVVTMDGKDQMLVGRHLDCREDSGNWRRVD